MSSVRLPGPALAGSWALFRFGPKFTILSKPAYFTVMHEILPRVQGVFVDGSDLPAGTSDMR